MNEITSTFQPSTTFNPRTSIALTRPFSNNNYGSPAVSFFDIGNAGSALTMGKSLGNDADVGIQIYGAAMSGIPLGGNIGNETGIQVHYASAGSGLGNMASDVNVGTVATACTYGTF